MNIQRSSPINISRYGRSRYKAHDFEELSCLRTTESSQSFSPNLGSPSPPETPDSSHCISCIGNYLLLEPIEGDHVFRATHLHSGEELVCKVRETHLCMSFCNGTLMQLHQLLIETWAWHASLAYCIHFQCVLWCIIKWMWFFNNDMMSYSHVQKKKKSMREYPWKSVCIQPCIHACKSTWLWNVRHTEWADMGKEPLVKTSYLLMREWPQMSTAVVLYLARFSLLGVCY